MFLVSRAPTRAATGEYLKAHWKEIDEHQLFFARAAFLDAAGHFCDVAHRRDLQSFFTTNDVKDAANALAGAVGQIDYCIDFRQSNGRRWRTGCMELRLRPLPITIHVPIHCHPEGSRSRASNG